MDYEKYFSNLLKHGKSAFYIMGYKTYFLTLNKETAKIQARINHLFVTNLIVQI